MFPQGWQRIWPEMVHDHEGTLHSCHQGGGHA
jgi:hypothetical protein